MKNKSILLWVLLTLTIVGSLPFLLSWYQLQDAKVAIIDQTQKSHMIISRATADRINNHIKKITELSKTLGNNPTIYIEPNSKNASELLKATLLSHPKIIAIGLTLRSNEDSDEIIQILNKNQSPFAHIKPEIQTVSKQDISLLSQGENRYLRIAIQTARPHVYIKIIQAIDFTTYLAPQILGDSARLDMVNSSGNIIFSSDENIAPLSKDILKQIQSKNLTSSANREPDSNNGQIYSLAKIDGTHWSIVSRQPIKLAELAATKISSTAWKAFIIISAIMTALLLIAYYSWVKPIRSLIKSYNKMTGKQNNTSWQGDEVRTLEKSFSDISKYLDNKHALSQTFVDRYQVISAIGFGGMGSVFLGWDPRLKRHVALKTLPIKSAFGSREDMSDTLVQEAITAAKISHSNVVSIYDVVSTKNTAFIAMEYINGESLYSLLKRKKKLSVSNTLSIAIAISKGLESAHNLGFVHRDIKPENILLGLNGDIKLTDFGTTVLLQTIKTDKVTGSPAHIAPEIYLHGKVSIQSDLFALGVVLVTCLVGKNPFKGKTPKQTKFNIINKNVSFPKEMKSDSLTKLVNALQQVLNKDPNQRPKSAAAFIDLIRDIAPDTIKWNPAEAGIQSTKEIIYAQSNDTTVVNLHN